MPIGYEEENGKTVIQNLVSSKYQLRFVDVKPSLNQGDDIFLLDKDTVSLKEPKLYLFLSKFKKYLLEVFMEWAVETVLPRQVWKLTSAIEEKGAALVLLTDDPQNGEYENVALQAQRDVYQAEL